MNHTLFQEEKTHFADVAVPLPLEDPFTYRVPEQLATGLAVGSRVKVPFRNRQITAFVVAVDSERAVARPKDILEVLDSEPLLTDHLLRLAKWVSEYYFSSWGEAIANMLPKYLKSSGPAKSRPASAPTEESDRKTKNDPALTLNTEQTIAEKVIRARIQSAAFSEIFLHGVTGGGKSELYIRAIQEVLRLGKSAICLVPEIALTEQLKHFFIQYFGAELEILHSQLTDRDRSLAWRRIRAGDKRVILGARSAVFAPAHNLALIIMDEEQETSYKQDQSPRYHAREVARWRAQDLGAVFLLGTATPTMETMHRAQEKEIELLTLTKRIDDKEMPGVRIVDLKQAQEISKQIVILSDPLKRATEEALARRDGILMLLNRRGFSTHIRCLHCSYVSTCPSCAVALTYHQETREVLCHYCNHHAALPDACPKCRHAFFKFAGIGTEKVESEVARLFPKARVARLDRDTAKKRGAGEEILKRFRDREIDILIGTQMIAKGFDFPHVTLVGIINADTGLLLPDFRSAERTFQLLTQMAGRSGRGKDRGNCLIQTYSPEHYAIQHAARHDYHSFFAEELNRRRELNYPPFAQLINMMFRAKTEKLVMDETASFHKLLTGKVEGLPIELIGPAPLPIYRLRGHYRWHLMLRSQQGERIKPVLRAAIQERRLKKGVYLAVDVDPVTIL